MLTFEQQKKNQEIFFRVFTVAYNEGRIKIDYKKSTLPQNGRVVFHIFKPDAKTEDDYEAEVEMSYSQYNEYVEYAKKNSRKYN